MTRVLPVDNRALLLNPPVQGCELDARQREDLLGQSTLQPFLYPITPS